MQSKHQSSFENYEAIDPKLGGFRPIYIYLDWLHLVYSIYIYYNLLRGDFTLVALIKHSTALLS